MTEGTADGPRVEWRRLDHFAPHPENPKDHDIEFIKTSIRRYGFRELIGVNESGLTGSGHGRHEALSEMHAAGEALPAGLRLDEGDGMWVAPCVVGLPPMDEAQEREFLIVANRGVEKGGWNTQLLAAALSKIEVPTAVGFDENEVKVLLEGFNPPDFAPGGEGDQGALDSREEKTCPNCGHVL